MADRPQALGKVLNPQRMSGSPIRLPAPLVSIIIVNWNGRELLSRCLAALSKQTLGDFEIIVVDNGSSDGSAEFLRREHPAVRLVELPVNTGCAGGTNAGYAVSRGRFIMALNNDMEPCPNWLENLLAGFSRDPRTGLVVGKILFFDRPNVINAAGDLLYFDGIGRNRGLNEPDRGQYDREQFVPAACAGAAGYRREMLDETGFLDDRYFAYFEDVDLSLRAIRRGWKCLYLPSAVTYHHHMSTTKRKGEDFLIFHGTRNKLWNIVKDYPDILIIPALLYSLGGSMSFVLKHGDRRSTLQSVLRGIFEAIRGLAKIRAGRLPTKVGTLEMVRAMKLSGGK